MVNIDYDVDLDTTPPRMTQYSLQGVAPAGTAKVRVIGQNNGNNIFKLDANCLSDGVTVCADSDRCSDSDIHTDKDDDTHADADQDTWANSNQDTDQNAYGDSVTVAIAYTAGAGLH